MIALLSRLERIDAPRQPHKVKHLLKDIVGIVLFATLVNTINVHKWTQLISG